MAVLAECPMCHKKQAVKNKACHCGANLDKIKKNNSKKEAKVKVRYWINYRMPGGKQRREPVGFSVEEARDADGKRRVQKRENRIFDIKPEAKMTFNELTAWYLTLETIKALAYYRTLEIYLRNFNKTFGSMIVRDLMPVHLEDYQAKRKAEGYSDAYIDHEVGAAKTMINKALKNKMVSGDVLLVFQNVKKLLKRNSNARDRILAPAEFNNLVVKLHMPTKAVVAMGYYTGMRAGEILPLTRPKVDFRKKFIKLDAEDTKDGEPRIIPICDDLCDMLADIPVAIHDDHLFLYKGKPIKNILRGLKRACKDAGIKYGRFVKDGFVFHDLRHTFNTNLRKAGVAESVIMAITGHSTREMFDRYNTIDEDDKRKAVNQMEEFLKGVDQTVDQAQKKG